MRPPDQRKVQGDMRPRDAKQASPYMCSPWGFPAFDYQLLIANFGTPLFIFSPQIVTANVRNLQKALSNQYPDSLIAYSVKTNYLPSVVEKLRSLGVVPEVVPGLELEMLERLGWMDNRVVVNGPLKTEAELERIINYNCHINVDNIQELQILEALGRKVGRSIEIGLRVTAEIGPDPWLRFGFRLSNGEAFEAARMVRNTMPHLHLVGLHMHGGTNITNAGYYREASQLICQLAQTLVDGGLIDLRYLDLGGGYATDCPFKDALEWSVPSADDYIAAIVQPIRKYFSNHLPKLILEPGRYLVDNAFLLLTTVECVKGVNLDEVVLDAGINVFPSARFRRHRALNLSGGTRQSRTYSLFGPLCMRSDCLANEVALPECHRGDVLTFDYAGAYSFSQAWTFIRLQPAVVAVEDDSHWLIRKREDIDHFLSREIRRDPS